MPETGWKKYASTEHRARSRSRSRSPIAGPDSEHHEARESHYVPRSPRRRPSRRSSSRSSSRTRSRSRSGSPSGSHSPYHTRRRTHSPESHSLSPDASLDIRESFSPAPISTDQEPYTSGTDPEPLSPANDDDHSSPVPTAPMVTDEHRAALRLLRSLPVTLRIKEWGSDPLVESSDEDEQIDYDEGPLPAVDRQPRKEVEERGQRACIVAYYVGPDDSEDKVNSIVKALVGAVSFFAFSVWKGEAEADESSRASAGARSSSRTTSTRRGQLSRGSASLRRHHSACATPFVNQPKTTR